MAGQELSRVLCYHTGSSPLLSSPFCKATPGRVLTTSQKPRTYVVFLLAGDGVAADLSVLDSRQIPAGEIRAESAEAGAAKGYGLGEGRVFFLVKEEGEAPGKMCFAATMW